MDKAAWWDGTSTSFQNTPLQGIGVNECGAFAGTQSALWDGLGFEKGAKLVIGRCKTVASGAEVPEYTFEQNDR